MCQQYEKAAQLVGRSWGLEGVSWHTHTAGLAHWQSIGPAACSRTACIQSECQLPSYPEPLDSSPCGICCGAFARTALSRGLAAAKFQNKGLEAIVGSGQGNNWLFFTQPPGHSVDKSVLSKSQRERNAMQLLDYRQRRAIGCRWAAPATQASKGDNGPAL